MSERKDRNLVGLVSLAFTFWAGAQWTVGYLVTPLLFARLERMTAGAVAGELFHWIAWLGVAVGLLCLGMVRIRKTWGWRGWVWSAVVSLSLVALFVLQPMMGELKAAGLEDPQIAQRFARLHGASSVLYLVQSLLAVVLAFAGPVARGQNDRGALSEGR